MQRWLQFSNIIDISILSAAVKWSPTITVFSVTKDTQAGLVELLYKAIFLFLFIFLLETVSYVFQTDFQLSV